MSCMGPGELCQPCLILPGATNVQLATSKQPEISQDHQISRAGGPMAYYY